VTHLLSPGKARWTAAAVTVVFALAVAAALAVVPAASGAVNSIGLTRQFGTSGVDGAVASAVDGSGNVYVTGWTSGSLAAPNLGGPDVFLRKYHPNGTVAWTRQFGTSGNDEPMGVACDASGNVYVAGFTDGSLRGANLGSDDAFLRKYSPSGSISWTSQFGTLAEDRCKGLAVDAAGHAYVIGLTAGVLPSQASAGAIDAFARKFNANGTVSWTRQFGTAGDDIGQAVAVDGSGNVFLGGNTSGSFATFTNQGGSDAFVRKLNSSGVAQWTREYGGASDENLTGVAIGPSSSVFVAGQTGGALPGQASSGNEDAFVSWFSAAGSKHWDHQFGTAGNDDVSGVVSVPSGEFAVIGDTNGTFPGQTSAGNYDVFAEVFSPAPAASGGPTSLFTRQFGSLDVDFPNGGAFTPNGKLYIAGQTAGTFAGQSTAGSWDAFVVGFTRDSRNPLGRCAPPLYSTNETSKTTFRLHESIVDPFPSSGIAGLTTYYKVGFSGAWKVAKSGYATAARLATAKFTGTPGKTYYFRSRAKDNDGNVGPYSSPRLTVVPYDQNVAAYAGGWATQMEPGLYKGSTRYSFLKNATMTYSFTGARAVTLIVSKRTANGIANVFIDSTKIKTLDCWAAVDRFRVAVPIKSWTTPHSGVLKVVVLNKKSPAAPSSGPYGMNVEIDGIAIRR
jgi:hypothetical protein